MPDNLDNLSNLTAINHLSTDNKSEGPKTVQSQGVKYTTSFQEDIDLKPLDHLETDATSKQKIDDEFTKHSFTKEKEDHINTSIDKEGKIHVAQMYDKQGNKVNNKVIPEGRYILPLNDDPRFNIEILSRRPANEGEKSHANQDRAFLKYDSGKGAVIVEVDINELANKLLMNKDKLIKIINGEYVKNGVKFEGGLEQYMQVHEAKFKNLAKIMDDYEKLCGNIGVQSYSATLMKVVKEFHKAGFGDGDTWNRNLGNKYQTGTSPVEIAATKVNGTFKITLLDKNQHIKDGSYGQVFKVLQMDTNTQMALKTPHDDLSPAQLKLASDDILNEYNILNEVHATGEKVGIQKPLHAIYNLQNGEVAYTTEIYNMGSGDDFVRSDEFKALSFGERVDLCLQLAEALNELEKLGILHLDNKLGNLLVAGPPYKVYISDFGDARHFDPANKRPPIEWKTSPKYEPSYDMKTEVSFKTAVYQIGLVMHGLLAGRLPTITNDGGNMNVVINEKSMKRYPEKLVALVSSMCALNPADRPSPQEVFRELSAIKRDHPELNEILAEAELEDSQPEIQDTAPFQNSSSKERAINE